MPVTAREAALHALLAFKKQGIYPDSFPDLPDRRDEALAGKIMLGVLQNRMLLDRTIAAYSSVKPERMESAVLEILRISAYQLLFLTRVPASAAVSEGVTLAGKYANPGAARLVNAVLRRISENAGTLPPLPENAGERLSVLYSHPLWYVRRLDALLGRDRCEAVLKADNAEPETDLQLNTLRTDTETAERRLAADGLNVSRHPWLPNCLTATVTGDLTAYSSFRDGLFYVQDAAARLAVCAAGLLPGFRVIDGCAAPGGKSFAAAMELKGEGSILSCDLREKKLSLISEGASRLGISILQTRAADGTIFLPELDKTADAVLADVPCSGFGVIRRKPEIRYKTPEETSRLPEIQFSILSNLSRYVRPGGVLLYSTCTVLPEENGDVIARFLRENADFVPECFSVPGPFPQAESGRLTIFPDEAGTDGFYLCKLRRRAES